MFNQFLRFFNLKEEPKISTQVSIKMDYNNVDDVRNYFESNVIAIGTNIARLTQNDDVKEYLLSISQDYYPDFDRTSFRVDQFLIKQCKRIKYPINNMSVELLNSLYIRNHILNLIYSLRERGHVQLFWEKYRANGYSTGSTKDKKYCHFNSNYRYIEHSYFINMSIIKYDILEQLIDYFAYGSSDRRGNKLYLHELLQIFFLPEATFIDEKYDYDIKFDYIEGV